MAFYTLLRNKPNLTNRDIIENMDGNLCRCTGYRPILDVMKTFTSEGCCGTGGCEDCPGKAKATDEEEDPHSHKTTTCCAGLDLSSVKGPKASPFLTTQLEKFQPESEFIFPPALKNAAKSLHVVHGDNEWFAPQSVKEFLEYLVQICPVTIIYFFRKLSLTLLLLVVMAADICSVEAFSSPPNPLPNLGPYVSKIKSRLILSQLSVSDSHFEFGSAVTFEELIAFLTDNEKASALKYSRAFANHLSGVANRQVRSQCTVGGNVVHSEWHSDVVPALYALVRATSPSSIQDPFRLCLYAFPSLSPSLPPSLCTIL